MGPILPWAADAVEGAAWCQDIVVYLRPRHRAHLCVATIELAASRAGEQPARARLAMRARALFWIRRYGPPEVACLMTMLAASVLVAQLTDSPPLLAFAAIAGATVGFYGVLVTAVMREQLALLGGVAGRMPRAFGRSFGLLAAEFGVAEITDTFFLRPALMMAGVVVIGDAVWGLLVGKLVADVLFYIISGVCFRVSVRTGIRMPRPRARPAELHPRLGSRHPADRRTCQAEGV